MRYIYRCRCGGSMGSWKMGFICRQCGKIVVP